MAKQAEEQAAEKDAAVSNLDQMTAELTAEEHQAQADDAAVADEVSGGEAREVKSRLDAAEAEKAALMGAAMAVSFMETVIKSRAPYVEIPPDAREAVKEKLAPVLRKSGGGMPRWLQPWKEEIELGMVLFGVGLGIMGQVQAHRHAEAEQQAQQDALAERRPVGGQHAPMALASVGMSEDGAL